MVDSLSGDLTRPNAGVLGSVDSITGAPENRQGEAVENEASNFVTGLAGIGVNIMSSGDVHGEPNSEENSFSGSMKASPNELAQMIATGKDKVFPAIRTFLGSCSAKEYTGRGHRSTIN